MLSETRRVVVVQNHLVREATQSIDVGLTRMRDRRGEVVRRAAPFDISLFS